MQYAWANPNDTTDILLHSVDAAGVETGLLLVDGLSQFYVRDGAGGTILVQSIGAQPAPQFGIYNYIPDGTPPPGNPLYYTSSSTYAFAGAVGSAAATVTQTVTWIEIPIEQLYEDKRRDIATQDDLVTFNAVDTALSANWWIIVTATARFRIGQVQGSWGQRQINGQSWPGGPNTPRIGIYNANTQSSRRELVTASATWGTIYDEITQHDQATGNATQASSDALDAAYDNGNGVWQDVADHDAQNPAWGYPPTVTLQL